MPNGPDFDCQTENDVTRLALFYNAKWPSFHLPKTIPGSGGLRKLRWSLPGRGKRGGARVIYYWAVIQEQLLMLFMYPKSERDDLTAAQIKILRTIVEEEYL